MMNRRRFLGSLGVALAGFTGVVKGAQRQDVARPLIHAPDGPGSVGQSLAPDGSRWTQWHARHQDWDESCDALCHCAPGSPFASSDVASMSARVNYSHSTSFCSFADIRGDIRG